MTFMGGDIILYWKLINDMFQLYDTGVGVKFGE